MTVAGLRADAAEGIPPFFHTVELEPGEEYRATVVTPDDEPAEGIAFTFWGSNAGVNPSPYFLRRLSRPSPTRRGGCG